MNSKSYNTIFILLSTCILFILIIQAFWIKNTYQQKQMTFNSSVYSALDYVNNKLHERENLRNLGTIIVEAGDTIIHSSGTREFKITSKPESKNNSDILTIKKNKLHVKQPSAPIKKSIDSLTTENAETVKYKILTDVNRSEKGTVNALKTSDTIIHSSSNKEYIITSHSEQKNNAEAHTFKKNRDHIQKPSVLIEKVTDSLVIGNTETVTWEIHTGVKQLDKATADVEKKIKEVDELLNKMYLEIKTQKSKESDVNAVNDLIKKALNNKGIFSPFEFSMRKIIPEKTELICQTNNFKETDPYFIADLSASKVFPTHKYLWLQFPNQNQHVLAGMKSSLALSLLFSLIVIGVFYYVILLILKQKKLSEIKNDFINNMTHELKTPIATISLALDAINNPLVKNDAEKFKDYSRILKEENHKLNKHVERVLQMALLDKGELPLHSKEVDLISILNEVVSSYTLQIQEQEAKITVHTSHAFIKMKGDEEHLKVVFSNLLDNALKYSKTPCEIQIQIKQINSEIEIVFKDNGIGIDAKNQLKIFDKFYREQGGNLHDVKGFGIGLSYAQSIVEKHNGTIKLQSEKGKGSSFIILFKI